MPKPAPAANLLPLTPPVFHILLALADEERHGYSIMQDVARQTNDSLQIAVPHFVWLPQAHAAAGLVEESDERPIEPDDERRSLLPMIGEAA
jgi:hypothetical protein